MPNITQRRYSHSAFVRLFFGFVKNGLCDFDLHKKGNLGWRGTAMARYLAPQSSKRLF